MSTATRELLASFESLPESDKRELAGEIIRRYLHLDFPPLTDEALVENADALFRGLDREEGQDGRSNAR